MAGDTVTLGLCYSYLLAGSYFEMVEVYSKKLTEEDVKNLSFKNHFPITREAFPEMDVFGILPQDFSNVEILVSAIVNGEKDSSTSFLSPMPDMPPKFHVASQTFDDTTHMRLVMQSPQAFAAEVGEKALSLSFVFMEDMEDGHPEMYRVSALSKDAGGKVDGISL